MTETKLTVALVQASPVLFDKTASIEKAVNLIDRAAEKGARLIVFPESFIPCYPRGLSFGMYVGGAQADGRQDYNLYYRNCMLVPADLTSLQQAAKRNNCFVSMGITEKDEANGTLYCTNVFISDSGEYMGKHRKIKPTGAERCIWGEGGSEDLRVFDTPFGKIGCLICWENYMPLARTALYEKGIDIYIAPTADSRKEWQSTVRHIAQEGRCFVLSCNQFVTRDMYPDCVKTLLDGKTQEICPGGSCIISPTGKYIVDAVYHREEVIIATLDMTQVAAARLDFDPCGHYSRPDILSLSIK
jgi:nitrilase